MKYCLAIDIGASSGRHIIGWLENNEIKTEEVYRFPNGVHDENGHLIWDVEALEKYVREGIDIAISKYEIASLSIDTWGVDYVLLKDDEPVLPCFAYRDERTDDAIKAVHEIVPFEELYARTGSQFQKFNSLYQLYTDKMSGRLEGVTDFLMVPEFLSYRICGVKAKEFTNATTTGMIYQGECFDMEIVKKLGLPDQIFKPLLQPGCFIGTYKGIDVVLCATHDTASAVEGIPMEDDEPYISSGTWSLLGVKTPKPITNNKAMAANYSNEGGVGYNRFQKNIMGMWVVNRLKDEIAPEMSFDEIVKSAENSTYSNVVDVNSEEFLSPKSMKAAFDKACLEIGSAPETVGDYFRCAYVSLAESYKTAINELEGITGKNYRKLYIVGGGAKNAFLNKLTAEKTKLEVIALPIEATALGNLKIQLKR